MSELDLDAIEAREREAWPERDDCNDDKDRLRASVNDVTPLVAEVRRLRELVALRTESSAYFQEHLAKRNAELRRLRDTVQQVREMHTDSPAGFCPSCARLQDVSDTDDGLVAYPCPTIRALDGGDPS